MPLAAGLILWAILNEFEAMWTTNLIAPGPKNSLNSGKPGKAPEDQSARTSHSNSELLNYAILSATTRTQLWFVQVEHTVVQGSILRCCLWSSHFKANQGSCSISHVNLKVVGKTRSDSEELAKSREYRKLVWLWVWRMLSVTFIFITCKHATLAGRVQ